MNHELLIGTMGHNLLYIRKFLDMSAREFGELIGVTRQTIHNIESGRYAISKVQYLAFMYVFSNDIIPNLNEDEKELFNRLLNEKVKSFDYSKALTFKD